MHVFARRCVGCGKPRGCIAIAGIGYWHLRCFQMALNDGRVSLEPPRALYTRIRKEGRPKERK